MPIVPDAPTLTTEQLILDPDEETEGRVELDIHDGVSLYLKPEGPDFGDAGVEAYKAKVARGELVAGFSVPNRQVRIPLIADSRGGSLQETRRLLQAKVARIQQEGGVLKRVMSDGATYYLDLVTASVKFGAATNAALGHVDLDCELNLEAIPDFYGPETEYDPISGTGAVAGVIELDGEPAVLPGDYPGRCRIEIDNGASADQLGLLFGVRSRYYDNASTAALKYSAQSLTPLDTAANATVASTAVVRHQNLSTSWTPVLGTNLTAGAFLTHRGTYRVWARVYSTSATPPKVRFVYDVGDLTLPAENPAVAIPGANNFYLVDLGEIRLDRVPAGDHRWQGVVQAKGTAGGELVSVAELEFQPLDESACAARPAGHTGAVPPAGFAARDEFNQTAGNLATKTPTIGTAWTGAGDSDDFTVNATDHRVQRVAISDANANAGRYAIAGMSASGYQAVTVDLGSESWVYGVSYFNMRVGVLARYVDTNNWLMAVMIYLGSQAWSHTVFKRVAGTVTQLATATIPAPDPGPLNEIATPNTVKLVADHVGGWKSWNHPTGSGEGVPLLSGYDPDLAPGGTLATGKPGIYDAFASTEVVTRSFDNFAAWLPEKDAVVFASQSAELSTDALSREDATGNAYGPIANPAGDLPRIPPSGLEERRVEMFGRMSRGNLGSLPDTNVGDTLTMTPHIRPSWLAVPGS